MASVLNITRTQRDGAYADVLDFLDEMSSSLGSVTNAAASMIRNSEEFKRWSKARPTPRRRRKAS